MSSKQEKELSQPFWTPARTVPTQKKKRFSEHMLGSTSQKSENKSSPNFAKLKKLSPRNFGITKSFASTPDFQPAKANTKISPRNILRNHTRMSVPDIKVTKTKTAMKDQNCILWFLQNFPKIILESAATKKYIIAKPRKKNTPQMKVWKGKPPLELLATCQYYSATNAYTKTKECFKAAWDQNNNQISLSLDKKKFWIIDQFDIVRLLRDESQFDRKWFEITLYGDFFSLKCPVSSKYIGVNEYDQQLECKQSSVSTSELLRLCIKGHLRVKGTSNLITVLPDCVQASSTGSEAGNFETFLFEVGGANCRIYTCSGISQRNYRRYLSCWKDQNIEGTWHLGFPLNGHDESDMGSLVEEQFDIFHVENGYFTIRACNDHYVAWTGSRLQASRSTVDESCLFEILCHQKKKTKVINKTLMAMYTAGSIDKSETTNAPASPYGLPPPVPKRHNREIYLTDNHIQSESYISEEIEEPMSLRENYRRSVSVFLKNGVPSSGHTEITSSYSTSQYVEDELIFKEVVLAQLSELAETTDICCSFGCLFVTNYRLIFVPNIPNERDMYQWSLPLSSLSQLNWLGQLEFEEGNFSCFAFEVVAKHWVQIESAKKRSSPGYHFFSTSPISSTSDNDPAPVLNLIMQLAFPMDDGVVIHTQYFAFTHRSGLLNDEGWNVYSIENEYNRQIRQYNDSQRRWMIYAGNKDYTLCPTYPNLLIQPYGITDQEMFAIATHRSKMRVPAVTWIHPTNGAAFIRCSQPKQGWRSSKSHTESKYFSLICSADNPLIWIMDARPQINAMANRLKGAGYEDLEHYREEKYTVRIKFLGIGNIHVMRDSLRKLQKLCLEERSSERFSSIALSSCWFDHVKLLLRSSQRIANKIHGEGQSVVLHCSDGWDRTAQLASLSQIILDGYFRTVKGFCVLIEKDWLSFGHKFADRLGQGDVNHKGKERSPIFVQFIDCVWQLMQQHPNSFEFNEWFLLTILEHVFSARFGTFLYNTVKEREHFELRSKTHSLWNILINRPTYVNQSFDNSSTTEFLDVKQNQVALWRNYYLPPLLNR